tara:strand:+ start:743 stop:1714 length:972 start_codon:yes stop_codon:yes gene_type:complete
MKFYRNKKIFIAGGSGLVGTNLLIKLVSMSKKVNASYNKNIQIKKYKKFYKKYNFINYEDCLKATKNKDIVFITAVKGSGILNMKKNFDDNINYNFLIRSNLLKSCVANKVKKVLWVSSSTVYQPSKIKIKEKDLNLNIDPYDIYLGTGWLYRYLEKLCLFYNQSKKMDIKILRTSSIYGPYDNFDDKKSHVIPALIKKSFNSKKNLEVWGDPAVVRDFVYVEDLVNAMINFIPKKTKKILNFSNGNPVSIRLLAKTILKISRTNKKIIYKFKNRSSAIYRVLNNSNYNKNIKKIKRTTLEDGLKKTYEWLKKNKKSILKKQN